MDLDPEFLVGSGLEHSLGAWGDVPFFEAETIFYFALLGATGYEGEGSCDPFGPMKRASLLSSEPSTRSLAKSFAAGFPSAKEELTFALEASLWGNVHDLSHFGLGGRARTLLMDDRERAVELLFSRAHVVDLILDNAGAELLADLFLSDALIRHGKQVRLHHKPRPFFVSDATHLDCMETIAFLSSHGDLSVRAVGARLREHLDAGRLRLETDAFWCRPLHFTRLPAPLRRKLGEADVLVCKGDLNYRRIIEDRAYPPDQPVDTFVREGLPPLLALRVLKSEVLVGLEAGRAVRLSEETPDWRINGEFAVAQLFPGAAVCPRGAAEIE